MHVYVSHVRVDFERQLIVAIDGPAGSGKSTTARRVARQLNYLYLDTGAMYRAVALAFIRAGRQPSRAEAAEFVPSLRIEMEYRDSELRVLLNDEDVTSAVRTSEVSDMASRVSALPVVREKLVAEQRRIARRYEREGGGVVLDGRDIGTVVFPAADVKVFMTAEPEERARRRYEEMQKKGETVSFNEVLERIRQRDRQDRERDLSPLRRASDAIELDTTSRSIEDQVHFVIDRVRERRENS